jgi:hypothetical protein
MKFCVIVILLLFFAVAPTRAQTSAPPQPSSAATNPLAILTPDQQVEYAKARAKALADDPLLDAENDALKAQYADVMLHGTPAQKQAILEKVDAHRLKLRQAMLKEDPNLGPIFAQIDAYISEQKAKGGLPAH